MLVKDYDKISMPLTDLLKKDNLVWTITATETFEQLKRAGTTTPVLAMPDFTKVFVVECDACGSSIKVVLSVRKCIFIKEKTIILHFKSY